MASRAIYLSLGLLLACNTTAQATGGFDCSIDDPSLVFTVAGTTGRGMGSPIIGIESEAEVKLTGTPAALTKLDLSKALVHHWLEHPDLNLHFYAETTGGQPFASAELLIKTRAIEGDDIAYEGDYVLKVYQAEPPAGVVTEDGIITATGKATCGGE
jgi:hypothetical protein